MLAGQFAVTATVAIAPVVTASGCQRKWLSAQAVVSENSCQRIKKVATKPAFRGDRTPRLPEEKSISTAARNDSGFAILSLLDQAALDSTMTFAPARKVRGVNRFTGPHFPGSIPLLLRG